jgi:hypothetical protein
LNNGKGVTLGSDNPVRSGRNLGDGAIPAITAIQPTVGRVFEPLIPNGRYGGEDGLAHRENGRPYQSHHQRRKEELLHRTTILSFF